MPRPLPKPELQAFCVPFQLDQRDTTDLPMKYQIVAIATGVPPKEAFVNVRFKSGRSLYIHSDANLVPRTLTISRAEMHNEAEASL